MMSRGSPVLVSWIAVNNDPYERERDGGQQGEPIPGPTLSLLFDQSSPYAGRVDDVVLLHRTTSTDRGSREARALAGTVAAIRERNSRIHVHTEAWQGDDPTDHRAIFEFLRSALPPMRRRFGGRELVIHISPGTPSMHTIWVLMAETGFVQPPFTVVKSYRNVERAGRPLVVPVEVGIETFYKAYKASRPLQVTSEDQSLIWDPANFRTDAMRRLFAEARRFARLNVPVLILGERGTGKTTLAGWLRLNSPFRRPSQDVRWPAVACGQYSPETMRAELFGYRKGAFTGAVRDSEGLLTMADGDTLFLDEVGDVARDLQRLLIKALEEKSYLPLGDEKPRKSDFRLLTATNVEAGELRQRLDPDFLDRISMVTLRLPPLREIPGELPWLWESACRQAALRAGTSVVLLTESDHHRLMEGLSAHPLPGNLRDLFRVAYRLLAAMTDPDEPMRPAEAVDYALAGLSRSFGTPGDGEATLTVARAFANKTPLDGLLSDESLIRTKDVERDIKSFMAEELRRISKARGVPVEQLCDVTERTLRTWADDVRKK